MSSVTDAPHLAESLLAPLGRRWRHVQQVAATASRLAAAVPERSRESLVAAAWLHDIGYAPEVRQTDLHPLDGARYLAARGWPDVIVNLVAHHSGARFEAEERKLSDALARFPFEPSPLQDALDTADLTTGPDGQSMTFDERMDEILHRYPPSDPVHKFWLHARPVELEAVRRTEVRLMSAQPR